MDSQSILYIYIRKNLKGNKVQITLSLASLYLNDNPPPVGEIKVDFEIFSNPKKNTGKIPVPIFTPAGYTKFYLQSPHVIDSDSAVVELTFADFYNVYVKEVKVEIFLHLVLSPSCLEINRNKINLGLIIPPFFGGTIAHLFKY